MDINWQLLSFHQLSTAQLYEIMELRQEVFVVEQNCPYLDCDNNDQDAHHLLGRLKDDSSAELVAYLRILPPRNSSDNPHIGRVVCRKKVRQNGIGKELLLQGITNCSHLFPDKSIKISAQQYLVQFYIDLGFQICSTPYDEDGIPHLGMIYEQPT